MRLISTLSFSGYLYDKIEAAARAGFDGIELFREDMVGFEGTPADVVAIARREGIKIAALQSLRDVEGLTGGARTRAFQRALRFMDLAAEFDASMLVVCANTLPETDPDPARAANDLAELAAMAAERGLKLGYEPLAFSRHTYTPLQGWELVKAADHPNLGLIIGSAHYFATGDDSAALKEIDPERIFMVHLGDCMMRHIERDTLRRANRVLPGQGVLPLGRLMRDLRGTGYKGPFSIEVFDANERGLPAGMLAGDAMRAMMLTEAEAEGRAIDTGLVGAPNFLHLRAAGRSAESVAGLLHAIGFVQTPCQGEGQQRLFVHGDLAIVLDKPIGTEPQLSIAGLGLLSPDPERLRQLADPRGDRSEPAGWPHRYNPFGFACLHGPSDVHFYLTEKPLVDLPFAAPDGVRPAARAGQSPHITGIDHIAQAFHLRALLSGFLYYRAALNFRPESQHEILDPRGAVTSHVLRNGAGRFALNLNAARGESTMTRRFIGEGGAAPIHHVAFTCENLTEVASQIDPAQVLRPPSNYYTDLMLRLDLPADTLEQLRAGNLFYDEDPQGSYLQLYTRTIDGVFFELVERRGNHAGFGAGNAAARITAQSRDYESHWAYPDLR